MFFKQKTKQNQDDDYVLYCSFCAKSHLDVDTMVVGPNVFICNECIDVCNNLANKEEDTNDEGNNHEGILDKNDKNIVHCYYLFPPKAPFTEIYGEHIIPYMQGLGFPIEFVEDIYGSERVLNNLWDTLDCSEIIIADLTTKNPSVLFILGVALAIGKSAIIVSQNKDDIPFDFHQWKCVIYSNTPNGIEELKMRLVDILKATFEKSLEESVAEA